MPLVKFINENKEIEVPEGAVLRTEAIRAGINLNCGVNGYGANVNRYVNCKGLGMCGTCRVLITEGMENANPMTRRENWKFKTPVNPDPIAALAFVGNEDKMRLACTTRVYGDMTVESGPELDLFGENFFS